MKLNMGILDRVVRAAIVVLVAVLYFTHQLPAVWAIVLGILAVVFLLTSVVGFCPIWLALGISTKKKAAG